jgi:hypothetical protein
MNTEPKLYDSFSLSPKGVCVTTRSCNALCGGGLHRRRKNLSNCHPEEAKPVLSIAKEGPQYLLENSTTGVLRFAQDDSI